MKLSKFLMAGITAGAVFASAQTASAVTIFTETFDNPGAFDNPANWVTSSSAAQGRISRDGIPTTAAGAGALWMDVLLNGVQNRNEAILTLDLTGCGPICWLSFSYAEVDDETHSLPVSFVGSANGDGVSISADGTNWHIWRINACVAMSLPSTAARSVTRPDSRPPRNDAFSMR